MNSLRVRSLGFFVLTCAALTYSSPGHNPGSGHMGGVGHPGIATSSHSTQSTGHAESHVHSPQQLLSKNSRLSSNLQKLLPTGTTPEQACSGFRNLGRCVAAIHVSHNLGIPFADLKGKLTGSNAESLGKAIHDLRPGADSKVETKKANQQAKSDMNESES